MSGLVKTSITRRKIGKMKLVRVYYLGCEGKVKDKE